MANPRGRLFQEVELTSSEGLISVPGSGQGAGKTVITEGLM
jgi:hypothetical protein